MKTRQIRRLFFGFPAKMIQLRLGELMKAYILLQICSTHPPWQHNGGMILDETNTRESKESILRKTAQVTEQLTTLTLYLLNYTFMP